ncbi:phosphonate/organophosphate ester transporter subunit [Photobacterium angustum]|uniref:phosphonate ABC transporter ATP-binding protein n=1 Tax=Photobacterium angustum TaxID=661 RepID=UPI0005E7D622|nr:phosphonate ABC transporter ATP-binding protein [Photobacterium angustum]KJF93706.1 phosphonate/organophosphate ester transporter subunit [Photobacterium angustum]KJG06092.1 phosphonate/organophosphate ester transporter subunit [Photobacterium angustum]PSV88530.1 phosphonate ABC transporter ATP-binding protein [Photobacterium angustum]PSW81892.1 phosphonate ABC transporter ATP-binding protein [Photobacterium angustum]
MDNIIEVKALTKTFGNKKALDAIGFSIQHQEMTALLGPSGSGKSTLMRHLSGLVYGDKDHNSEIRVLGEVVQANGRATVDIRQRRAQAGYIFQQFNLVNRLTVLTNVLIGAMSHTPLWRTLSGRFSVEQKQQALAALERVGMSDFAHQRVSTLSGGQQQRVAIARALMQKAKIIFADEPIASLDPESSRIVMELLTDINQREGIPVVVTLHQVEHALKYCKHVIALKEGKVFYQGESASISQQELEQLYSYQPKVNIDESEPLPLASIENHSTPLLR